MEPKDIARRLPDDIWEILEPLSPPVVWRQRPSAQEQQGLFARPALRLGFGYRLGDAPPCWPSYKTIQRRLTRWLQLDVFRTAWGQLAQQYEQLQGSTGIRCSLRLQEAGKKRVKRRGQGRRLIALSVEPPCT